MAAFFQENWQTRFNPFSISSFLFLIASWPNLSTLALAKVGLYITALIFFLF